MKYFFKHYFCERRIYVKLVRQCLLPLNGGECSLPVSYAHCVFQVLLSMVYVENLIFD